MLLPLIIFLTQCAGSGVRMSRSAQEQSLAAGLLTQNIRTNISQKELSSSPNCSSPVVQRVSLQSSARGPSGNLMTAREHWYVDSCGRSVIYQVDYYGPISEHTAIDVKPLR